MKVAPCFISFPDLVCSDVLRDGQSFALAGLLDNSETRSISKIPVLGDVPILGNLFKSTQFQKQETELVFLVTADLVKPTDMAPEMYNDWGDDVAFSLKLGRGECAA